MLLRILGGRERGKRRTVWVRGKFARKEGRIGVSKMGVYNYAKTLKNTDGP